MKKVTKNKKTQGKPVKISRKKAITKIGLTALSAATMMLLLNDPAKGQDNLDSPNNPSQPPQW